MKAGIQAMPSAARPITIRITMYESNVFYLFYAVVGVLPGFAMLHQRHECKVNPDMGKKAKIIYTCLVKQCL